MLHINVPLVVLPLYNLILLLHFIIDFLNVDLVLLESLVFLLKVRLEITQLHLPDTLILVKPVFILVACVVQLSLQICELGVADDRVL